MSTIELVATVLLGLIFFLVEEFRDSWAYAVPAIAVPLLLTGSLSRFRSLEQRPVLLWCMLGTLQAGLTSILRVGLVYGGYVSFLRDVNCFGRQGLDNFTYVAFAFSGALAGGLISRYNLRGWLRLIPLFGISLGVLYAMALASGFWSLPSSLNGVLLITAEFLAPVLYGWLMVLVATRFARYNPSSRGSITRFARLSENDEMLLPRQVISLKSLIHSVKTDIIAVQDPCDEMLPECSFFIPNLLAEFSENPNLAMIHGLGNAHAWIDVEKLRKVLQVTSLTIIDYKTLFCAFRNHGFDVKRIRYVRFRSSLGSPEE